MKLTTFHANLRQRLLAIPHLAPVPINTAFRHLTTGRDVDVRMDITNEVWTCPPMKRVHLEYANVNDRVDIVHCTIFPDQTRDLPILGIDCISYDDIVTLGICDLSPTREDRTIPFPTPPEMDYQYYGVPRALPDWTFDNEGNTIFSDKVVFVRSPNMSQFQDLCFATLDTYMTEAPMAACRNTGPMISKYMRTQQLNPKTLGMLVRAFGKDIGESYMRDMLFPVDYK